MSDVEINLSDESTAILKVPQQSWFEDGEGGWLAFFAGHQMTLSPETGEGTCGFQLRYLGLVATGFTDPQEAMASAGAFALEVFDYLRQMISD